ncbi:hypothetical protein CTA2_1206 [Colletotrichum tanaceti]|nr:hypothetical protein CTA2_1206 [Colletotrichum tanaceti]
MPRQLLHHKSLREAGCGAAGLQLDQPIPRETGSIFSPTEASHPRICDSDQDNRRLGSWMTPHHASYKHTVCNKTDSVSQIRQGLGCPHIRHKPAP